MEGGWGVVSPQQSKLSFLFPIPHQRCFLRPAWKLVGDYSLDGKNYITNMNVLATTVISYKIEGTRVIEKLKDEGSKALQTNLPCKSALAPANSANLHWKKDYKQDHNLAHSPAFHHTGNIKKKKKV